jgi:hypothetical protein
MKLSVEDIKELLLDCISKGAKIEYDFCNESIADDTYNSMSEEDRKIVEAVCLALRLNDFEMYSEKDIKYVYDGLELKALPSDEEGRQKMMKDEKYRWDFSPVCMGFYRQPNHTYKSPKDSIIEKALILFNSKSSSRRVLNEVHCYKGDPHITMGFAHHAEKGLVSFFEDMYKNYKDTFNLLVEYIGLWRTLQNYTPAIPDDIGKFLIQDEKEWTKFANKFKGTNGDYPTFNTEKCWLYDVFHNKKALMLKKVADYQVKHYEKVFNEAQKEAGKITTGQKPTPDQEAALTLCMLSWKSSGWANLSAYESSKDNIRDAFGIKWTDMTVKDKFLYNNALNKYHVPTSNFYSMYRIGKEVSEARGGKKPDVVSYTSKDVRVTPALYTYINDKWSKIERSEKEKKLLDDYKTDIDFMTLIVWLTYNIRKGYIRERQKQIWDSYMKEKWDIDQYIKDGYPKILTDVIKKK